MIPITLANSSFIFSHFIHPSSMHYTFENVKIFLLYNKPNLAKQHVYP